VLAAEVSVASTAGIGSFMASYILAVSSE